jgi:glycosyltransferase involved in cell wall biosynthesis
MLSPWSLQHRKWKKRLAWHLFQRRDLQQAQVLHVTSDQEADEVRAIGARQPIAVIPNGVTVPATGKRKMTKHSRRALFLSRLHPKKGVLNLIDAWAEVRPKDWELVLAGPDDEGHQAQVIERIRRNQLTDVSFTGAVDDTAKWDLYRSADLFVLPTFSENFGIVIGEALGMGVPVITTKGAPWSGISIHQCGWWIDTGTEPLIAALREATSTPPSHLAELGDRGRRYVIQEFSWGRVAQDLIAVYEWMLQGGEIPPCLVKS